ncbi:MAG: hypothetical protein IJW72_03265 [Alphaproteobacteria bacterium]|nr:hypothetical protein [Alphaproteobacteria bacterium]
MSTVLNKVFTDKEQRSFRWVNPDEVTNEGGFITNIDGKVVAFMNGERVRVPKVLYNEVGRPYYYISNLKELGEKMARKHGVWKCSKNQPIRVYKVVTEADIKSIINGVQEAAGLTVTEDTCLVQNIIGGEFYVQTKEYLNENYSLVRSEGICDVYEYTGDIQEWTYCEINIFAALWGGIQFLATPMLRIDNPKDVYGCNYIRFWGDDQTVGTHVVLAFFRACGTQFFSAPLAMPVGVHKATFDPPKSLLRQKKIA